MPSFSSQWLTLGPDSLDGKLFSNLVSGTGIGEIEIAGFASNGAHPVLVDDYAFMGANATAMSVSGSTYSFGFSYSGYEATHHPSQGAPVSTTWNAATNNATLSRSPTMLSPGAPPPLATNSVAPGLSYYVQFTPQNGSALKGDNSSTWFKITDPSFGFSKGSGPASFGPLSLSLDSSVVSEDLQKGLFHGTQFTVEIASYVDGASGKISGIVDDYTFGRVSVTDTGVDASAGGLQSYGFNYQQFQDRHTSYDRNTGASSTTVSGWDVGTKSAVTNLSHTATNAPPVTTGAVNPTTYYVRFFDAGGHPITGGNGSTWFSIPEALFGFTAAPPNPAQGGRPGVPLFGSPSLSLGPDSLDGKLFSDLVSGTGIGEIEIAGFASNGAHPVLVDDYAFMGVTATQMSVRGSTSNFGFSYSGYEATHHPSQGTAVSTTWNAATNNATLSRSPTMLLSGSPPPVTTNSVAPSLSYYVQFTPLNGLALKGDNGSTWFKITDPSFGFAKGSGPASFGALSLWLDSSVVSEELQKGLFRGTPFTLEMASYIDGAPGKISGIVDDYTFGRASVTDASVSAYAGGLQYYGFGYQQFQDRHTSYDRNTGASSTTVSGWDVGTKSAVTNLSHTAANAPPVTTGAVNPTTYYVRFFDAGGHPITGGNGSTWFSISSSQFLVTAAEPIPGQGGGPGVPSFSSQWLTLGPDSLDGKLFSDLVSGTGIREIEVAGFASNGAHPVLVDDYAFMGANATQMSVSGSTYSFAFSYSGYEATHHPSQGAPVSTTWNAATNNATLSPSPTMLLSGSPPPVTTNSVAPSLSYYVQFTSLNGLALRNDNGSTWFKVTDPSFYFFRDNGRANFGTLSLSLDSTAIFEGLQRGLFHGTQFTLEMASYVDGASGKISGIVDDYTFGRMSVSVAGVNANAGGLQNYGFDYQQFQDRHTSYDRNSGDSSTTVSGWDVATQNAVTNLSHTAPSSPPPCYCRGTLILTDRGEVPVETLAIGDNLVTGSGIRTIKWIGRRSYAGRFILGQKDVLPVCFKAGSLGADIPRRDLWISPHHAMFLEGILIEARHLVNGVSVVQAESVEKVEYFHVELHSHDVIVAEAALSETFVDDDSRGMFHNAHEYRETYGDAPSAPAVYCAPRREDGYEIEAARLRINARAGLISPVDRSAVSALRGYIDVVEPQVISGWAQNVDHPEAPVCLDIYAGGRLIGQALANRYRDDLQQAGLGSGCHSFEFIPPAGLRFAAAEVDVRRAFDGQALTRSRHPGRTKRVASGRK